MTPAPSTRTVSVVQAAPRSRDLAANIAATVERIAGSGVDLVVLPELFLTGYQTVDLDEIGLTVADPRLAPLASACAEHRTALLVGFVETSAEGAYDAILAIDRDGRILPAIRKTHLFGDEGDVFRRGDTLDPIDLCGVRIGVLNCFEVEFPEVARTLVLKGAELLIAASANMHPYEPDHRIATIARALENRVPLAYANRVGSESDHDFCGASRLVAADGTVLGQLGTDDAGSATAELSIGAPTAPETDMLAQRRPELYA